MKNVAVQCPQNSATGIVQNASYISGYTSMSIYTGTFDHVLMRYLVGPEVEQMDAYSLIRAAEAVPEEEVAGAIAKLTETVPVMDDVKAHKLYKTMALYVALKNFCAARNWTDVNELCKHYAGQHYALAYGDWADELESFAKLMGMQTIRI